MDMVICSMRCLGDDCGLDDSMVRRATSESRMGCGGMALKYDWLKDCLRWCEEIPPPGLCSGDCRARGDEGGLSGDDMSGEEIKSSGEQDGDASLRAKSRGEVPGEDIKLR
jgi:hypothetical protein